MESTPVSHSESACQLPLSIRPLVVALLAKSGPIFVDPDFFCCSPSNRFPLHTERLGIWNLHQFRTLNPPVNSLCPYDLWLWRYWQSRPPFLLIPSFFVVPPHHHFPLQSELLGERNLDQFCTPNTPVISVCPYDLWLWRY